MASALSANISGRLGHEGDDDDDTSVDMPHKDAVYLLFSTGHTLNRSHTVMSKNLQARSLQPLPISRLVISQNNSKNIHIEWASPALD